MAWKERLRGRLGPALPWFDRRVDWRLDQRMDPKIDAFERRVLPHYARQEALDAVSEDVTEARGEMSEMLVTMRELRRWMIDNLDASGETAVLLGETLTRLQGSIDALSAEVRALAERLTEIERAPAG